MVKNQHKNTIIVGNMRMLHFMCDITRGIRLEMTTLERERERERDSDSAYSRKNGGK